VKLIQLKNGDWINPSKVWSIRARDESLDGQVAPRLIVEHGDLFSIVEYPSFADACKARDNLARSSLEQG
jgi:hypothetical protein